MQIIDTMAAFPFSNGALQGFESEDLDFTLVEWESGHGVDAHRNDELDVLMVVIHGSVLVTVDGQTSELGIGKVVVIPKGTERQIRAGADGVRYLNVHNRRRRLMPGSTASRPR